MTIHTMYYYKCKYCAGLYPFDSDHVDTCTVNFMEGEGAFWCYSCGETDFDHFSRKQLNKRIKAATARCSCAWVN